MKTKPHLKLRTLPGTNLKLWYCIYRGEYAVDISPRLAYIKMKQQWNAHFNWNRSVWL